MRSASFLLVGAEMLKGIRSDSNARWLARKLTLAGWRVSGMMIVEDDDSSIVEAVESFAGKVDLVIISGGLGPTHDDRTRFAMARVTKTGMRHYPDLVEKVIARFPDDRKEIVRDFMKLQGSVPEAALPIFNPVGTALGIDVTLHGTRYVSFPGVPSEFKAMALLALEDELKSSDIKITSVTIIGRRESEISPFLDSALASNPGSSASILPSPGFVTVDSPDSPDVVEHIKECFPDDFLRDGGESIENELVSDAIRKGLTLSVAESCTGGLISKRITDIDGSSACFWGGIVCYSNKAKIDILGVSSHTVANHGAVSEETALEMCNGVLRISKTDIAVSVTGIAGPTGGSSEKPVGTVWLTSACSFDEKRNSRMFRFFGDREQIRAYASNKALEFLWRMLKQL